MSAVDYWLEIEGVESESQDETLTDAIQIDSFQWGEKNKGSWNVNGGGGQGKVEMGDFSFSMLLNKATPKLFLMCATGEHVSSAKLTCRKAGGEQSVFFEIEFTNLCLSSCQIVGGDGLLHPKNTISFNFEAMEVNYMDQSSEGSSGATVTAGYNLKKNQKM